MLKRPVKVPPRDHSNRIKTIVRYSNKLPGLSPAPMTDQTKNMAFDQHPEIWQRAYIELNIYKQAHFQYKFIISL
eukprot:4292672-Ditylum_brightwellii.AAC.1